MQQSTKITVETFRVEFEWKIQDLMEFPWAKENFIMSKQIKFDDIEATCYITFYPEARLGDEYHQNEYHCFKLSFQDDYPEGSVSRRVVLGKCFIGKTSAFKEFEVETHKSLFDCKYYNSEEDSLRIPLTLVYNVCSYKALEVPSEIPTICIETVPDVAEVLVNETENNGYVMVQNEEKFTLMDQLRVGNSFEFVENGHESYAKDAPDDSSIYSDAESIEVLNFAAYREAAEKKDESEATDSTESSRGSVLTFCDEVASSSDDDDTSEMTDVAKMEDMKKKQKANKTNELLSKIIGKLSPTNKEDLNLINWVTLKKASKENKDTWGTLLARQANIDNFFDVLHCAHIWDFQLQKELVIKEFIMKQNFKTLQQSEGWKEMKQHLMMYREIVELILENTLTN